MERKLIVSRIQTPDGTILSSKNRHDYVTHIDKNGLSYFLDGGTDYQRCAYYPDAPHTDISIYSDSPYDLIREHYCRGSRGKNGTDDFKWVPLNQMNNEWLEASIEYNQERGMGNTIANKLYSKELKYRRDNGIKIIEE